MQRFTPPAAGVALAMALAGPLGCASAPAPQLEDAYYKLDVPAGFRETVSDNPAFDAVYQDPDGALFFGVVSDEEPVDLPALDDAVRENLALGEYERAVVTRVTRDIIDGVAANRSDIFIASGDDTFTMINVHCATEERNIQLVVWGLSSKAHRVRALAEKLRDSFSFRGAVSAKAPAARDGSGHVREDGGDHRGHGAEGDEGG